VNQFTARRPKILFNPCIETMPPNRNTTMNAISILPPHADTTIRFAPAKSAAAARPVIAAEPHRFTDGLETAMTGLVFTGALLFAAGLLHIAAPAGAAAMLGVTIFHTLACLTGAATLAGIFRAFRR
jgi:hypothetical protein